MKRIQTGSAYFGLKEAVDKMGDMNLGSRVLDRRRSQGKLKVYRPQTTAKNLKRKLEEIQGPKPKDRKLRKKQKLDFHKEVTRFTRSMINEDYSSEEEKDISSDSD